LVAVLLVLRVITASARVVSVHDAVP
jgi:hypothetical protein